MEKRFESYDWLKAIGSLVFLVAAILPWWTREYTGFELRRTGFGDWIGIIAAIAILAVGLLTVIVETESLPIPRWVLNPTWMLALAIFGAVCVGVRFFLDPFGAGDPGIRDGSWARPVPRRCRSGPRAHRVRDGLPAPRRVGGGGGPRREDDDDDGDDVDEYGYDADEQDELIRRINESMERQSSGRRRRPAPEAPSPPCSSVGAPSAKSVPSGARRAVGARPAHRSPERPDRPGYRRRPNGREQVPSWRLGARRGRRRDARARPGGALGHHRCQRAQLRRRPQRLRLLLHRRVGVAARRRRRRDHVPAGGPDDPARCHALDAAHPRRRRARRRC